MKNGSGALRERGASPIKDFNAFGELAAVGREIVEILKSCKSCSETCIPPLYHSLLTND